jgi:hypothetical protein
MIFKFPRYLRLRRRDHGRIGIYREGKFALVHDGQVVGTFDTYADALSEGYRFFKLEPFLVKQPHIRRIP